VPTALGIVARHGLSPIILTHTSCFRVSPIISTHTQKHVNFVGGLTFLIAAPQKLNRGTSLKAGHYMGGLWERPHRLKSPVEESFERECLYVGAEAPTPLSRKVSGPTGALLWHRQAVEEASAAVAACFMVCRWERHSPEWRLWRCSTRQSGDWRSRLRWTCAGSGRIMAGGAVLRGR